MDVDRVEPGPGQESVWDYPRPPRVEGGDERVVVRLGGQVVDWITSRVVGPFKGGPGTLGW